MARDGVFFFEWGRDTGREESSVRHQQLVPPKVWSPRQQEVAGGSCTGKLVML